MTSSLRFLRYVVPALALAVGVRPEDLRLHRREVGRGAAAPVQEPADDVRRQRVKGDVAAGVADPLHGPRVLEADVLRQRPGPGIDELLK